MDQNTAAFGNRRSMVIMACLMSVLEITKCANLKWGWCGSWFALLSLQNKWIAYHIGKHHGHGSRQVNQLGDGPMVLFVKTNRIARTPVSEKSTRIEVIPWAKCPWIPIPKCALSKTHMQTEVVITARNYVENERWFHFMLLHLHHS